jgi:hypothetical protein
MKKKWQAFTPLLSPFRLLLNVSVADVNAKRNYRLSESLGTTFSVSKSNHAGRL